MRLSRILQFALAAAVAVQASSAGAQITTVSADVTTPTTWCDDEDTMLLLNPIFVTSKLTIEPGCVVRGNPRTVAFDTQNPTVGAPGALIISQDGFLDAQGTASNPIIMTTAATDNDNDGIVDRIAASQCNPPLDCAEGWNAGDLFIDDTPATNPLAPLDQAGRQTAGLWGGLVLLGRAPTNLGDNLTFGYGAGGIEGLAVPGYPANGARYGGYQPHDSSGIIRYVSIRHAGDEIGEGNELNGATMGGVGDGTIFQNVEVYANQDDGMEWFGGTMNASNLSNVMIGDDSVDIDQGFNGNLQNVQVLQTFFNQNSGDVFGAASGDNIGEWDGDDCDPCNIQIDNVTFFSPTTPQSWPNAHPQLVNATLIGALDEDANNPAVSVAIGSRGLRMRDGWTGAVINTIITNSRRPCEVEGDAGSHEPDIVRLVSTTISGNGRDVGGVISDDLPNANCTTAVADGDAAVAAGEYDGGTPNVVEGNGAAEILVNDNYFFVPTGVVSGGRGKLAGSKVGGLFDPRPASPTAANVSGGVAPHGAGLDASATYRGAFPASQPLWTAGWTVLSLGGLQAD